MHKLQGEKGSAHAGRTVSTSAHGLHSRVGAHLRVAASSPARLATSVRVGLGGRCVEQ